MRWRCTLRWVSFGRPLATSDLLSPKPGRSYRPTRFTRRTRVDCRVARVGPTTPKPVEPKLLRSVDPIDARRDTRNPEKLSAQTAQTFAPRLQNRGIAPSNSIR